ncbi:thiol-activated cytolysin family protein [Clostridium sp. SHJSY1]|uniref:thiol-activated cytolysin family protein n=1 Tax=Clostridium sp. SHJSY1 TaxID=2942483 RepID=UPI00287B5E63|nr:thiol-activated cytolysin family protein [Clostridium sp. SHJSY1]
MKKLKKILESITLWGGVIGITSSCVLGYSSGQVAYAYENNSFLDTIKDGNINLNKTQDITSINDGQTANILSNQNNSKDIDNNIYRLSYDSNKILSFNGETVESFVPSEGYQDNNKYIEIKRSKKSISDISSDISVIDSTNNRTYPGAIQLANRNLIENKPDIIACERKPITLSVDLPGMSDDSRTIVNSPTYSSVNSSLNSILDTWNTKYSSRYSIPTRMSYTDTMVYSKSQLAAKFGGNFKILENGLNIDFDSIYKGEKKAMIVAYKQIFYTASIDSPQRPSDLFGDNVTYNDLTVRGVNNDNPPAYVSSVSYGRTIYVKLESTSKSANVKAAFNALIENQGVSTNAEYQDIINQSSFTAVVLGGGAQEHNKIISKNFDDIRNVIKNNSVYSSQNPGYPISYTTAFLKDNKIACTNNKTEYIETTTTEHNDGKIILDHSGAYVAKFIVTWDEVNYDKNGNEIVEHKAWEDNNKGKTAHFNTRIYLKGNSRNISVKVGECTGLAWEWWRTIIDEKNVPLTKEIIFSIKGTTLYPQTSIKNTI